MFGSRPNLTLTQRLLALVAVAAVPAFASLVYFILAIHQEREREVRDQAFRASQVTSLEVERIVTGAEGILQAVALSSDVTGSDPSRCVAYLDALAGRLPQFRGFDVIRPDGTVLCASSDFRLRRDEIVNASWFRDARATGVFSVGVYSGAQPGMTGYLPLALPVVRDGRQTMIVLAAIDLDWLAARLGERSSAGNSSTVIADRTGVILARHPDNGRYVGREMVEPFPTLLRLGAAGVTEITASDGVHRIIGYQPPAANSTGLYVGNGISTEFAFRPIYASTWRSAGIAAVGVLAAAAIIWALGNRLLRRPLLRILATVESWRAGDDSARTGITRDGSEISFLAAATDEYMDAVLADRAARRAAEEQGKLLLREMSHRIKNLLATVQALANQTFRDGADPDSLHKFGQRLSAMAATHDLLVSSNWQRTWMRNAVNAALHPFGNEVEEGRFEVSGPDIEITARAAFALSMALHELCTNALKYGALSTPSGRVAVRWDLVDGDDGQRLHFRWQELDGPPCAPPTRTGFGTRLMRAAFASDFDARTHLDFPASGFVFELDAEAVQILAGTPPPAK